MECKYTVTSSVLSFANGFNRYIVECKYAEDNHIHGNIGDLIDT